jgi:uncharacterized DUF497 family protein
VEFEWDNKKAVKNLKKYGVSFREAASFFGDPLAITFDDPDHSIDEDRFLTFGTTRTEKKWLLYPIVNETVQCES